MGRFIQRIRRQFIGPCDYPGYKCPDGGSEMFYPLRNGKPIYLCPRHKKELSEVKADILKAHKEVTE